MTVQIAAASTALVLGAERRRDGRWVGWTRSSDNCRNYSEEKALGRCGLVLDILGRGALREVRDGTASLNAVYERAVEALGEQERPARSWGCVQPRVARALRRGG